MKYSDPEVLAVEEALGIKFPEEYRSNQLTIDVYPQKLRAELEENVYSSPSKTFVITDSSVELVDRKTLKGPEVIYSAVEVLLYPENCRDYIIDHWVIYHQLALSDHTKRVKRYKKLISDGSGFNVRPK